MGFGTPCPFFIMGLLKLIQNFERLNLEKVGSEAMSEVKTDMGDFQREQLKQGLTSSGGTFRKYQNRAYARKKNSLNPLPGIGNPDLKLTGAFYRGISATVQGGQVIVKSSDEKAQELEAKYGKDKIFGLSPEEKSLFISQKLKPSFNKHIRNDVGL